MALPNEDLWETSLRQILVLNYEQNDVLKLKFYQNQTRNNKLWPALIYFCQKSDAMLSYKKNEKINFASKYGS